MSKRISNTFIKELVANADIVYVISRYVNLKKSGIKYKSCCPFHSENTPSFFVTPSKNFFHCFGCQESGDSIAFIQKINNIKFIDAVKNLAEIVGKSIEYENYSEEDLLKEHLYNKCIGFLEIVQKYYRWNLVNSETKNKAIHYLKKRGIDSKLAKVFGIGYSSEEFNNISHLAKSAKLTEDILIDTGLAIKNLNGHLYDRFRGRIMYPIRNIHGNVIAYGGRVIDDSDGVKYMNSPETLVFQKSNTLYGLYEYREYKKQKSIDLIKSLVVVEGYMDVIGLAKYDFFNAVATLGTAFSYNHAKIIFREINSVILCFDGDTSGQQATLRTIKIILPILDRNKKLKILTLPDGKDPDDFVKVYGLEKFKEFLESSSPVSEFLVNYFIDNKDLSKAESKTEIIENLKDFLLNIDDNIYSESVISIISEKIGIKIGQIKKLLKKRKNNMYDGLRNSKINFVKQRLFSINLTLEEDLLSELFVNILDFRMLQKKYTFEIFSATKSLDFLIKSLKILKEDSSNEIETVILIQILAEDYPDYRDYFFELFSHGIKNTRRKSDSANYHLQILRDLKRIEEYSIKEQLKYLCSLPFRTDFQDMERKYLIARLSSK